MTHSVRATTTAGAPGGDGRWMAPAAFITLVVLIGSNLVAIRLTNRELGPFSNAVLASRSA